MTAIKAAGIAYTAQGRVLLLKRRDGSWGIVAGGCEPGEKPRETAEREAREEIGSPPESKTLWSVETPQPNDDGTFVAFGSVCAEEFIPRLNEEHTAYGWFQGNDLPTPLYGATADILERFTCNMGAICRKIAEGKYTSPERFYNVTLFAMRISGTGWAYRGEEVQEYAYRDRDIWLTPQVMEACQGMPVVFEHPPASPVVDSPFYRDRVVGSVVYPYIKDKELWGIVRIQDAGTAEALVENPWSTSPGVLTGKNSVAHTLPGGEKTLIEDAPFHPDHLAIVPAGVWDKYGPPTGIDTPINQQIKEKMMAEFSHGKLSSALDALTQRCQDGRRDAGRHDDADQEQVFEKALEDISTLKGLIEGAKADDADPLNAPDVARQIVAISEGLAPSAPAGQPSNFIPGEASPEQTPETEAPSETLDDDALATALDALTTPQQDSETTNTLGQTMKTDPKNDRKDVAGFKDKKDAVAGGEATEIEEKKDDTPAANDMLGHMVETMRKNGCSAEAIAQCVAACGGNPDDYVSQESERDREIRDRLEEMNRRDEEHRQELERLARRTRPLTDEEHNEISDAEAKTDAVAQSLGVQTPRYIPGESVAGYKRRCAKLLQPHSEDWKHTDLSTLSPEVFALASRQIHHDAQAAAARPARYKDSDPIRPVIQRSPTGHTRTEYRGSFRSAFGAFMS